MQTIPVYTIYCDEEGCNRAETFPLMATSLPFVYELRTPDEVYAHHGGEVLPDGRHRCSTCRAALKLPPPDPKEVCDRLDRIRLAPSMVPAANILADDIDQEDQRMRLEEPERFYHSLRESVERLRQLGISDDKIEEALGVTIPPEDRIPTGLP